MKPLLLIALAVGLGGCTYKVDDGKCLNSDLKCIVTKCKEACDIVTQKPSITFSGWSGYACECKP